MITSKRQRTTVHDRNEFKGINMAGKQDDSNCPPFNMNSTMNAGMFGFLPMPVPVFTPPVMPLRMMTQFWPPTSASFMQQYVDTMSSGMAQVMQHQSSVTQHEPSSRASSKEDTTSVNVTSSAVPSVVANVNNEIMQHSPASYSKRTIGDHPNFPQPMVYPTFGGFVPFAPYFPYFNMPGNGFENKQSKDSDSRSAVSVFPNNELVKRRVNKQQPQSECRTNQEDIIETKPLVKFSDITLHETPPKDSNKQDVSVENSPEMDVAQILVNFMPVPVIGGIRQDQTHCPGRNADVSPKEKRNVKENVLVSAPINLLSKTLVSAASADKFRPENATPATTVTNCELAAEKDSPGNAFLILMNDATPKQPEQKLKQPSSLQMPEMQCNNNNYILNSNTLVSKQFTQNCDVQVSNSVSSSSVVLPVSSSNSKPVQFEHQPSPATYVKNTSQSDGKEQNTIIEDELTEISPKSQEYEQGTTVLEDQNAIPTVDDLLKGDIGGDKSTYKCEVCAQLFRSSLGLQKHLEFHMDDGQHYTCTICFQPFREAKSLDDHIALHMRNRPHKCTFCPKAFRDPGSLQKHVRVHTGEKPYKCTSCYQSFAEYSSLRKHLRVHTGEQPYRCQYCDKAFSISGNLQRHVLIHTGERPYKCSFCPKAFNNPSHLRRHVKNLHFKGEVTTRVVEDMISAIHGEVTSQIKKSLGVDPEMVTEGQNMEISQEEEVVTVN